MIEDDKIFELALKLNNIDLSSQAGQEKYVYKDYRYFKYIKDPSNKLKKLMLTLYTQKALKYITNPPRKIQIESVRKYPESIQYIENPSEEIQLIAVGKNGLVIEYIKNPSETVKLKAVQQNGQALLYIKNPSQQVRLVTNPHQIREDLEGAC